jgi:hypothetical protein
VTVFILRQVRPHTWSIFSPKGHAVTDTSFRGNKLAAVQWANAWISSFNAATLVVEDDEKTK